MSSLSSNPTRRQRSKGENGQSREGFEKLINGFAIVVFIYCVLVVDLCFCLVFHHLCQFALFCIFLFFFFANFGIVNKKNLYDCK